MLVPAEHQRLTRRRWKTHDPILKDLDERNIAGLLPHVVGPNGSGFVCRDNALGRKFGEHDSDNLFIA
jgi:hypothetical protein